MKEKTKRGGAVASVDREVPILILGGGVAGLAAAWALKGKNTLVAEKDGRVGGICRSTQVGGFTFDLTGHLLHFPNSRSERAVKGLLKSNLVSCRRNAGVYAEGRTIDFPYQANLSGLPWPVARECLIGLMERPQKGGAPANFRDWICRTYGSGIAERFMIPYNEKVWRHPLDDMTADWIAWRTPIVDAGEVLDGAFGKTSKDFGYNASFLYPKEGGIQALADALEKKAGEVALGMELSGLNPKARTARFRNGQTVRYGRLISCIPLPELIRRIEGVSRAVAQAAGALKHTSVVNVNLGFEGKAATDRHWIYYASPETVFYRAGVQSHFSDRVAPKGCFSYYVEIAHSPGDRQGPDREILGRVLKDLKKVGLMNRGQKPIAWEVNRLKYANVIYDKRRSANLKRIGAWLDRNEILSLGRFGKWDYSSIADAFEDAFRVAKLLSGRS